MDVFDNVLTLDSHLALMVS